MNVFDEMTKRRESFIQKDKDGERKRMLADPFRDVDTGKRLKVHPKQMQIVQASLERRANGAVRWPIIIAYGSRGGGKTSIFQHLMN